MLRYTPPESQAMCLLPYSIDQIPLNSSSAVKYNVA